MNVKVGCVSLLFLVFLVSCSVSVRVQGYAVDSIFMFDDVDPVSGDPIGSGELYFTHSGYAYCWVNLTDVYSSHIVSFDWYNPVGELYASHPITTESPGSGLFFPSYAVFGYMGIYENPPSSFPGTWWVKVYVDDNLIGTEYFSIIDYDAIIENIDTLESTVEDLISTFEQIISDYESIQEDYEDQLSKYNDLKNDYDNLTISYDNQISDYNEIIDEKNTLQEGYDDLYADYDELVLTTNQLVDDYDDIVADYDSLGTQLSNSRNITYVSAAAALIFLVVAIYMYTKKQRVPNLTGIDK